MFRFSTLSFSCVFVSKIAKSEFNEFEPRLKSTKKPVLIKHGLKSLNIEYNFKWNQPYLSRGLNSLNSIFLTLFIASSTKLLIPVFKLYHVDLQPFKPLSSNLKVTSLDI